MDGIYAVTNISIEIIIYIQTFILVNTAFFLEVIQRSSLVIKKLNKQSKTDMLIKLTKNLVTIRKQPPVGVLRNRCSENMQQVYKRTPMQKCDFNKVALQLY